MKHIHDVFQDLIKDEAKKTTNETVAKIFNKERKWVIAHKLAPLNFVVDADLICGLNALGYELKIVKKQSE